MRTAHKDQRQRSNLCESTIGENGGRTYPAIVEHNLLRTARHVSFEDALKVLIGIVRSKIKHTALRERQIFAGSRR